MLLTTPPDFPPKTAGDFLEYLKLAARTAKLGHKELVGLVKNLYSERGGFSG